MKVLKLRLSFLELCTLNYFFIPFLLTRLEESIVYWWFLLFLGNLFMLIFAYAKKFCFFLFFFMDGRFLILLNNIKTHQSLILSGLLEVLVVLVIAKGKWHTKDR
jgi:hypothetical protein